jgi:hypothetical protein
MSKKLVLMKSLALQVTGIAIWAYNGACFSQILDDKTHESINNSTERAVGHLVHEQLGTIHECSITHHYTVPRPTAYGWLPLPKNRLMRPDSQPWLATWHTVPSISHSTPHINWVCSRQSDDNNRITCRASGSVFHHILTNNYNMETGEYEMCLQTARLGKPIELDAVGK